MQLTDEEKAGIHALADLIRKTSRTQPCDQGLLDALIELKQPRDGDRALKAQAADTRRLTAGAKDVAPRRMQDV